MDIKKDQEGETPLENPLDDQSLADQPLDYSEIIEQEAFLGNIPFDAIIEGLEAQFADYVNIEDTTNFVDVFYDQLHASLAAVTDDESEEHPVEIKEALDRIHQRFIDFMVKKFDERLTLTIMMVEDEDIDYDDLEFIIRRLYEFFILGAQNNFKVVIAADVNARIGQISDDKEWFTKLQEMMALYSPLVTGIKPMEFLRYRNDTEITELFENGQVVGNFLRKYSPKFYQNEEFQVAVINYVTMANQFGKEIING